MDNYHITKDDKGWKFQKEGSDRALKRSSTKEDVVDQMRDHMKDKTGSVKIHTGDGKFQEERTYQRKDDPTKSKG